MPAYEVMRILIPTLLRRPTSVAVRLLTIVFAVSVLLTSALPAQAVSARRCGTAVLRERWAGGGGASAKPAIAQEVAAISVGDVAEFTAFDFTTNSSYQVRAVCRSVGAHSYLFAEDGVRARQMPTSALTDLEKAFDAQTDLDPARGIFDVARETFGAPPDVDRDPRIFIVVLDIRDGSEITGGPIVGYFDPSNENFPGRVNREIIYIDNSPLDVTSRLARATLAHEFQHLIHWGHDSDEDDWVDEGCAGYAESVTGYASEYGSQFLSQPNNDLTDFSLVTSTNADYDKTFLFITFLADRYGGAETMRRLVDDPANGTLGVSDALASMGMSTRFRDVFLSWTVANYFGKNDDHGYSQLTLPPLSTRRVGFLPAKEFGRSVNGWAAEYLEFPPAEGDLVMAFRSSSASGFSPRVVSTREGGVSVVEIPLGPDGSGEVSVRQPEKAVMIVSNGIGSRDTYGYEVTIVPTAVTAEQGSSTPSRYSLLPARPNPFTYTTRVSYEVPSAPGGAGVSSLLPGSAVTRADKRSTEQRVEGADFGLGPPGDSPPSASGWPARVRLSVWDARGRLVRWLVRDEVQMPGHYDTSWDGRDVNMRQVASGVYVLRLEAGERVLARKLTIVR